MIPLFGRSFAFLRHGETAPAHDGFVTGATDPPLTAAGEAEARRAAETLVRLPLAAVWCSPLRRARRTAEEVARLIGLEPRELPELAERSWGALEGRPRREAEPWREGKPPGGESAEAFRARTMAGLARITPPWPALIVAHSGTARCLAAALRPGEPARRLGTGEAALWLRSPDGSWETRPLEPGCVTSLLDAPGKARRRLRKGTDDP